MIEPRVRYLQTLLSSSLALKFDDLKRRTKELGESFDFDRKAVCDIAIAGYKAILNRPKLRTDLNGRFSRCAKYFENISMEEDVSTLPEELFHVNSEDAEETAGVTGKFCKDDTTADYEIV